MVSAVSSGEVSVHACQHELFGRFSIQRQAVNMHLDILRLKSTRVLYITIALASELSYIDFPLS